MVTMPLMVVVFIGVVLTVVHLILLSQTILLARVVLFTGGVVMANSLVLISQTMLLMEMEVLLHGGAIMVF